MLTLIFMIILGVLAFLFAGAGLGALIGKTIVACRKLFSGDRA